ncbi:lipocalin family protein [Devosia sp. ZW T5_3]|uniref:lipocalin family protein n=1 Tax=Devosia sp. ZW T5_3 TaxID=3378085 RepID=UPI003851840E
MTDVTAIPRLDLKRYLGRWYEICRLPLKWEDETATDITANYTLNDKGNVGVDNRCFDEDGKPARALGEAFAVDDTNARLKVSFLPPVVRWLPFGRGDYWVLKIDPDYAVSLVGSPSRKYLWVLARRPFVARETLDEYLAEARRQGFDLTGLITPRHTGRVVSDDMVEGK